MLINIFNYKGHIICIRAYEGVYETMVSGDMVYKSYEESTAVQKGKEFVDTLPITPSSNL